MILRAAMLLCLLVMTASCAAPTRSKITETIDGRMPQLVGRWIFSPGDSSAPKDPEAQTSDDVIESPVGASISLGEGGIIMARIAEFVRRGTWRITSGSLKIIIDPPPERTELSFVPLVEQDRLTLQGVDGILLVYHRDPFIALPNQLPPQVQEEKPAVTEEVDQQ